MKKMKLMSIGLSVLAASYTAAAQRDSLLSMQLNIESQPVDRAVGAWSEQTGYQVLIPIESEASHRVSPPVKGFYSPEAALKVLLASTDLKYQFVNRNTVAIRVDDPSNRSALRYVLADNASAHPDGGSAPAGSSGREPLAQVIVTAQKREERLEDVPVPVTVLGTDRLANTNQLRVEDYYASVPGMSLARTGQQSFKVSIRGLSAGDLDGNPSVGVAIDDIAFGSALLWGGGVGVPDIDPGDLSRIEVLRGPQGTLYGTSSIGGLLKFVTVDPSTEKLNGRLQAGTDSIEGGRSVGYSVRGSVNLPMSETVALRASAYTRTDPGYVDDVLTGQRDVNEVRGKGGRVAMLWRPSDALTLKLSALVQRTETDGSSVVLPSLGNLKQSKIFGTGAFTKNADAFSATLTARLGAAELTSLSGYSVFEKFGADDAAVADDNGNGLIYGQYSKVKKWSQELRLALPLGERVDWLIGAFYTKEDPDKGVEYLDFVDPLTGIRVDPSTTLVHIVTAGDHQEYAAFTNFTFKFGDRFDVQLGGRQAHYQQHFQQVWTGDLVPGLFISPPVAPKDNAFTYLLTPRFRISSDLMVYARLASGYRTGGPNTGLQAFVLPVLNPDNTRTYELGLKGDFLDRRLTVDASLYYIDWRDMQIFAEQIVHTPDGDIGTSIYTNADKAKSQGLEISFGLRPLPGLRLDMWGAWNTAELTADMPQNIAVEGRSGDRLPDGSRFSGRFSAEQELSFGGDWSGYVGGAVSYMGARLSSFVARDSGLSRARLPAYARTDLTAGVRFHTWDVGLYLNNAFDRRGYLAFDVNSREPLFIQPRSVGINLSKIF